MPEPKRLVVEEHGLFRTGENLLAWMERCGETVNAIRDAAHALREHAAARTSAVDVKAAVSKLLKAVSDYNRLACGAARKGVKGFSIDEVKVGKLAQKAARRDGAAGEALVRIAYEAKRGHARLRRLLAEADVPGVADYLFEVAASPAPSAGGLERRLGIEWGERW